MRSPSLLFLVLIVTIMVALPGGAHASAKEGGENAPPSIWLQYGTHWRQTMELFVPQRGCPPFPVVVYIPGGGWLSGDSTQVQPYLPHLIQRGFAVASINHRWSQHTPFPGHIHDCKGAVRYLRAHAAQYNLDTARFGAFGPSSGGHLAALLGTSHGVQSLEGDVGGNLNHSSHVSVVGDIYGPTDLFELGAIHNGPQSIVSQLFHWPIQDIIDNMNNPEYAQLVALVHSANPITHVTANDPPFYIAHGDQDSVVPLSQSQLLVDALASQNIPHTFVVVAGAGHDLPMSYFLACMDYMAQALGATPYRPADITCDGVVNVNDLLVVINSWGACPAPPQACPGDVTNDGVVNVNDLLAVINDWG